MKIRGVYTEVDPNDLHPNNYNPNRQSEFMFEKQLRSLSQFEFVDPILVRLLGEQLEIVDGEHRWRAAVRLGLSRVSVLNIGEVDDHEAKQLTILMNELRGKADRGRMATLVESLQGHGADLSALPFTSGEMQRLLEDARFDFSTLGTGSGEVVLNFELDPSQYAEVVTLLGPPKGRGEVLAKAARDLLEAAS